MRNVAPSAAIFRRTWRWLNGAMFAIGFGVLFATLGLALYVFPLVTDASSSSTLFNLGRILLLFGGVALGILGLVIGLRATTWKRDNTLAKVVANVLGQYLGDQYTFIRNINDRRIGYIDAVLIGPGGILIFRLLDWEGTYMAEANGWLKGDRNRRWVATTTNPTKEIVDDIKSIKNYLGEYGFNDLPVYGIVVLTQQENVVSLTEKEPVVPATLLNSLYPRLQRNYLTKEGKGRLDKETIDDIVKLFYNE